MLDCSMEPKSAVPPDGRRSRMSQRIRAELTGKSTKVRPVRSPIMCMRTAAMTSSDAPSRSGTSSSGFTFTSGTPIMTVRPVSCDNAVAACPAPMLATSFSASS